MLITMPHVDLDCPHCGREIRSETRSEWLTSMAFGIPLGLLVCAGALGYLEWPYVIVDVVALCILAALAFPFVTRFVPADDDDNESG